MFTSDINVKFLKTSFAYFCASLFLILFGAVYEYYSHGVYSYFMIYAFAIPLVFGALVYFIRALISGGKGRLNTSDFLYCGSISVFTAGSITKGVLDIYGTENSNMKVYLILGFVLL
ncbi:MAG: hypothetical protein J5662_02625, partial [Clostridia bacterium]|nr:hypothetical protein [Clostridia bacterium]